MRADFEIAGQTVAVAIDPIDGAGPAGGRFRVTLRAVGPDGAADVDTFDVDARPTGQGVSVVYLPGGRTFDAAITPTTPGAVFVQLPTVDVDVATSGRRRPGARSDGAGGHGETRVSAPMPGRVVRVLVRPGETVRARQPLVVIEAMKMENELVSPRDGQVTEVHVTDGVSVDAGRLLVVVA